MFKGQITNITFDNLTLRYPPSVAQFLIEEIEKAALTGRPANHDPVSDMLADYNEPLMDEAVA